MAPLPEARQRLRCAAHGGMHRAQGLHGAWQVLLARDALMHAARPVFNLAQATQATYCTVHLLLSEEVVCSP